MVGKCINNTAGVGLRETGRVLGRLALEGPRFVGYCKAAEGRIRRKTEAPDVGKRGS